jgi:hypothetical protein
MKESLKTNLLMILISSLVGSFLGVCAAHAQDKSSNCAKVDIQQLKVIKAKDNAATIRVKAKVTGNRDQFFVVLLLDDYGLATALAREDLEQDKALDIDVQFPEARTELNELMVKMYFPTKDEYEMAAYVVATEGDKRHSCFREFTVVMEK